LLSMKREEVLCDTCHMFKYRDRAANNLEREAARLLSSQNVGAEKVVVPMPRGMRKPLEMIGRRLLDQMRNRFAIAAPIQFTHNEQQVLVAALETLRDALAASEAAMLAKDRT